MPSAIKSLLVAVAGLATALLTGVLAVVVERTLDISVVTLSVWFVVPVGAIGTGIASASGYWLASLGLHARATKLGLLEVVIVGALSYFLIHYIAYATTSLDDGTPVREVVGFGTYLDVVLTKAHYRVGHGSGADVGEVGRFGYALAALQIAGFLLGGFFAWLSLRSHAWCDRCQRFLRTLAGVDRSFADRPAAQGWHDELFRRPMGSVEFTSFVRAPQKVKATKGATLLKLKLLACPRCRAQSLRKALQIFDGRSWSDVDGSVALVPVPQGVNLAPALRAKG